MSFALQRNLDQRMRQRDAEKKGGKGATYHTTTHDPDAMQVDATKQTSKSRQIVKRTLLPIVLG